jgi:preprotein translocase subunit SecD
MVNISKFKVALILFICFLGFYIAAPNLIHGSKFLPSNTINLGLDLRGGSHLLFEVETDGIIKERLDSLLDVIRLDLRKAEIDRIGPKLKDNKSIEVKIVNFKDIPEAKKILSKIEDGIVIKEKDNGVFLLSFSDAASEEIKSDAVSRSIETIRRRIDETGTREPSIQKQGNNRILVQLPGIDDPSRVKNIIGKTAKLTFHMVNPGNDVAAAKESLPIGTEILPSYDENSSMEYVIKKRVRLSGDNLINAAATFQDNRPVVSFKFNRTGAKKFATITKENVGKPFAIVLDNKVISAPNINEPILGGSGIISGGFSVQEATDLALLLRSGALPAPMKILEERTVGPSLGADSINAGKLASIIGLLAVILFITVVYKRFGVYASIALVINVVLIIALLSLLQATLTLPGIAGIVLTIGMAVDANVLIFERIKEEFKNGRSVISSVDAGYKRALSTIVDSNLTTLIAALFLYIVGTGPVKGFAVTLSIGIVTSMFSAIMITRIMIIHWLRRKNPTKLCI